MGHWKFLPRNHVYRNQKNVFYGAQEKKLAPQSLTRKEILQIVSKLQYKLRKKIQVGKKKRKRRSKVKVVKEPKGCWKKKSIFFQLEYWEHLVLHHNLDVMHIEKTMHDSLLVTLLNIPEKTKDGIGTRLNLIEISVQKEWASKVGEKIIYLPSACFTLTKEEKCVLCQYLFDVNQTNRGLSAVIVCTINCEQHDQTH